MSEFDDSGAIMSTGLHGARISKKDKSVSFAFATAEGTVEVTTPIESLLRMIPLVLSLHSRSQTVLTGDPNLFMSFQTQGLSIHRDEEGRTILIVDLQGTKIPFHLHPVHIEALRAGLEALEGKPIPKPHQGTAH